MLVEVKEKNHPILLDHCSSDLHDLVDFINKGNILKIEQRLPGRLVQREEEYQKCFEKNSDPKKLKDVTKLELRRLGSYDSIVDRSI